MSASGDSDADDVEMEGGEDEKQVDQLDESNASESNEAFLPDLSKMSLTSSGYAAEMIPLSAYVSYMKFIPEIRRFSAAIRATGWTIRAGWQSPNEIYHVLLDLHNRQHYSSLNLVYLKEAQLIAICGIETEKEPRQDRYQGLETEEVGEDIEGEASANAEKLVTKKEEEAAYFIITGKFRTAVITGELRLLLEKELDLIGAVLKSNKMPYKFAPGWMLAITDGDQICYYVERMVTVEQLKAPDTTTREEELTNLFGKNRAINVRSARSREFHKSRKAFMQDQLAGKIPTEHQKARWQFQGGPRHGHYHHQNEASTSTAENRGVSGEQAAEPKEEGEDDWVDENAEDSPNDADDDQTAQLSSLEGCEYEHVRKNYEW